MLFKNMFMKRILVDDVISYDLFVFLWFLWAGKRMTWIIVADEIHGGRFYVDTAIPEFRHVGTVYTISLYRPVARNGIKQCSRKEGGSEK